MKRYDYFISIGIAPLPEGGASCSMMDDTGRYSDPDAVPMRRSGAVFPARTSHSSVCMGIGCRLHQCCEKYMAVDGSDPDAPRMATCLDDTGFPGFSVK